MQYELDEDGRSFHVRLTEAEYQKVIRDVTSVGTDLDEYIGSMVVASFADMMKSGIQPGD